MAEFWSILSSFQTPGLGETKKNILTRVPENVVSDAAFQLNVGC